MHADPIYFPPTETKDPPPIKVDNGGLLSYTTNTVCEPFVNHGLAAETREQRERVYWFSPSYQSLPLSE